MMMKISLRILFFSAICHMFQERRDGVTESCLYVNHVTSDSFRRYTIIAENAIAIGRQQTVLAERKSSAGLFHSPNNGDGSINNDQTDRSCPPPADVLSALTYVRSSSFEVL